ncbi:MAG TPA: heparan-alpha-glucosaminide N-acetyltransferase domain-containing protein [Thermoanaerobaculia bacterium]|nr:heparan-alpha-glucosaminide N-acetyltransferase domain-containing protein [Thermoanaerobaculia bacterium]
MGRLQSLDVFRGATVASMLLVNNPGTWGAIYWPLEHAEWHGCTPTDLIFPFFLFIVGITTELSRKEPLLILRRGALIVLCGLLLNAFPYFRLGTLRFSGVLQRIGVVYILAALIARYASRKTILAIVIVILLGYWGILTLGPLEPPDATVAATIDRAVLAPNHIWKAAKTWDPEGPLSTIPAVATALLGVLVTPWVRAREVKKLIIAGAAGLAIGLLWHLVFPINKNLWTSSYVVFTAGFACVILASCIWAIDIRESRGWTKPFIVYGVNPLIAFLGSGAMARLLGIIKIDGKTLHAWTYKPFKVFEPHFASLLWALAFVVFWWAILALLYRRDIILKI